MTKLERLVLGGIIALGVGISNRVYAHETGQNHIHDVNGNEWVTTQKQADNGLVYTDRLKNPKTGEEVTLPEPEVVKQINRGYRSTFKKEKKDTRSDLQKVKDGIKKGGNAHCNIYPTALNLYIKNKNTAKSAEYKTLASIACNECVKFRQKNNEGLLDEDDSILLRKMDELGIGTWETYARLAASTDNAQTQRYIHLAFNKNKKKAKEYILKNMGNWQIEKYNINSY